MAELLVILILVNAVLQIFYYASGQAYKKQIRKTEPQGLIQRKLDDEAARAADNFYVWRTYGPIKPEFYYDGSVKYNYVGGQVFPKGVYWENAYGECADFDLTIKWHGKPGIKAPEG